MVGSGAIFCRPIPTNRDDDFRCLTRFEPNRWKVWHGQSRVRSPKKFEGCGALALAAKGTTERKTLEVTRLDHDFLEGKRDIAIRQAGDEQRVFEDGKICARIIAQTHQHALRSCWVCIFGEKDCDGSHFVAAKLERWWVNRYSGCRILDDDGTICYFFRVISNAQIVD
jgi:hypothetical protein